MLYLIFLTENQFPEIKFKNKEIRIHKKIKLNLSLKINSITYLNS